MMTTMTATVLEQRECALLVCDESTGQEVLVQTERNCCLPIGCRVCIHYSGAMTMSLPPQITACCIKKLPTC